MKTSAQAPDKDRQLLDTSRMSEGQRAALEMTEAAREEQRRSGFAASLFDGDADLSSLVPFPSQSVEDHDQGNAFLARLKTFLETKVDPDRIDAEGEIPDEVMQGLAEMGAFGIKIPVKYGGLGLSQTNYSRAAMLLGTHCGNLTALLSAHQSIGVPQPLLMFGNEEQKSRFLPRFAKGEISAFALTEPDVGSDPARMKTAAIPDGDGFVLNGEKLWCTNGTKAGVIIVMAKTATPQHPHATTAFIVEMNQPGVEVVRRCHFMGLRALYNAVIRFENVRVPAENVLGGLGRGLKIALTTLNTGRITLPAACTGLAKRCLAISADWAKSREQWGQPIGKHAAIADKLARMAANTYAMEAMVLYVSSLVDRDKHADVRLEAALAKLWGTERAWQIVDDTMQIRGGRGYETAASQSARGEKAEPVERFFRDARINTLFEGSSEIMRLFVAREMLDGHLKIGAAMFNTKVPMKERAGAFFRAMKHYSTWYPAKYVPFRDDREESKAHPTLSAEWRSMRRRSRRLARAIFHAMLRHGPKLDREQLLLGRLVDVGAELFAWSCAISYAQQVSENSSTTDAEIGRHMRLVHFLGSQARERTDQLFHELFRRGDHEGYRVAKDLMEQ